MQGKHPQILRLGRSVSSYSLVLLLCMHAPGGHATDLLLRRFWEEFLEATFWPPTRSKNMTYLVTNKQTNNQTRVQIINFTNITNCTRNSKTKRFYVKSPPERVPGDKFLSLLWKMWWNFRKFWEWQILSNFSLGKYARKFATKNPPSFSRRGVGAKVQYFIN